MQAFPKAEGVLNAPEGLEGGESCESALPPPLPSPSDSREEF